MAVSNEDIFAWFSLKKVESKITPPSQPINSLTRAALAKREREYRRQEFEKDIVKEDDLSFTSESKPQEEEDDEEEDSDRVLNLLGLQDEFDYALPTHTSVFDPYDFTVDKNPKLPILEHKETIINKIESNSVTIIQGSTGSGKSTQVPQYILEKYAHERRYCNIICTQPRRIAATSVAKFVAERRDWRLGSLVGYQIAMDKLISEDTRLTFVTTGVLLQKLINMKNMNQFTHVILDEVHERDKDTDFCLLLVKTFLRSNSRNVKVILMSATLSCRRFARYFGETVRMPGDTTKIKIPAPIIDIDSKPYSVIEYHMDSILSIEGIGNYVAPSKHNPQIDQNTYQLASKLISYFDRLESQEQQPRRGTVLVFLPGMPEIQTFHVILNKSEIPNLTIVPLHSSISNTEQQKVFLEAEQGMRKIILATNIAESSVTVPDIKFVIDFCLVKELMLDKLTNYQSLKLQWASKASLTQRMGRAGRVSNGRCYRLITSNFHTTLNEFSDPEIKRVPLESLILYAKQMNIDTPARLLSRALEKPDTEGIAKAVINLKEVGALTLTMSGRADPQDGQLTQFGEILASLPVDIKVGKLLVLGHVFGILEDCLIIAACLSLKLLFEHPYHDEGMMSYKSKMSWAEYSFSDCIAMLNAYKEWLRRKNREFKNNFRLEREWCERNFIKKNVIREVSELIGELASRLRSFNIVTVNYFSNKHNQSDDRNLLILKLVIAGAFYPNYFRWGVADEEQAIRDMSGHDPLTTVMISGLPANPSKYYKDISYLFRDCGEGRQIHFESSRAYLEFQRPLKSHGHDNVNGVIDPVYIALKKRHAKNPMYLITGDEVGGANRDTQHHDILPPRTPKKGAHAIIITEVDTPGHFWAQYWNKESQEKLKDLMSSIRVTTLCPMFNKLRPFEIQGQYCLAMYKHDRTYYRGFVKAVTDDIAKVFFVDYGNHDNVPLDFVCILPPSLREPEMQAFECYLAGIKPPLDQSRGVVKWTEKHKSDFKRMVMDKELYLEVYSDVSDTLRVVLLDTNGDRDININESLVTKGIAVPIQEGYQSKQSHEQLEKFHLPQQPGSFAKHGTSMSWRPSTAPVRREGRQRLLKGPVNPYEVTFQSITRSGGLKTSKIESDSVNSIVVDSEPQDKHERLMVACSIGLNSSGNALLARNTTLLPNIHGLAHIVCMIFSPTIELRADELKRQYTGALCGLGFCPVTESSLYSDHDMELVFDSLISQNDIKDINRVRHAINLTLSSDQEWAKPAMKRIQEKARDLLLNVVLKPRHDVIPIPMVNLGWNQVLPEDVLIPEDITISQDGFPPLLPLHNGIAITNELIQPDKPAERVMLLRRVEAMEKNAFKSDNLETLFCDLCRIYMGSPNELLLHLKTRKHQVLKEQLKLELTSVEQ